MHALNFSFSYEEIMLIAPSQLEGFFDASFECEIRVYGPLAIDIYNRHCKPSPHDPYRASCRLSPGREILLEE